MRQWPTQVSELFVGGMCPCIGGYTAEPLIKDILNKALAPVPCDTPNVSYCNSRPKWGEFGFSLSRKVYFKRLSYLENKHTSYSVWIWKLVLLLLVCPSRQNHPVLINATSPILHSIILSVCSLGKCWSNTTTTL